MNKFLWILIQLLFGAGISLSGQTNGISEIQYSEYGTPVLIQFNTKSVKHLSSEGEDIIKWYLKLDDYNNLRSIKSFTDNFGYSHERFQHFYQGIKVEFSEYIVHSDKEGTITSMNGTLKSIKNLNINPVITEKSALDFAIKKIDAEKYFWQDEKVEFELKQRLKDIDATYYPEGELVIWSDWASDKVVLAYKFNISSLVPFDSKKIYIDAQNGNVIDVQASNPNATAHAKYIGTVSITTSDGDDDYILYDTDRNIRTYNLEKSIYFQYAEDFNDADDFWSYAEFHNDDMDDAAINAHWAAEKTYDYFDQSRFEYRNGWDNDGSILKLYAHYGVNRGNAWCDASEQMIYMGDGKSGHTASRPWTDVDIVAHEYGHAIYYDEVGSGNYTGEPGAIQEGLSDIWGACVDDYSGLSGHNPWLWGENVYYDNLHFRNFVNPPLNHMHFNPFQETEEAPYADVYHGQYWYTGDYDNHGVHLNSTVLSHWFYLLCEGEEGENSEGTPYDVHAIGISDVSELVYYVVAHVLTTNTTFPNLRTYTIATARFLFGEYSDQVIQTTNAWHAVGIGNRYEFSINGPENVCSWSTEFSVNGLPPGASIFWNPSDNITLVSDQNSNPAEFETGEIGFGWIGGTVTYDGDQYDISEKYVWSGTPLSPTFIYSYDYPPCVGMSQYFFNDPGNYALIGYHWYIESEYFSNIENYQLMAYVFSPYSQYITLSVNAENQCGFSDMYYSDPILIEYCEYKMIISPNPATDKLKIELPENTNEFAMLEVNNSLGLKVISTSITGKEIMIDISKLQKGLYYVSIFGKIKGQNKIITERFIKE